MKKIAIALAFWMAAGMTYAYAENVTSTSASAFKKVPAYTQTGGAIPVNQTDGDMISPSESGRIQMKLDETNAKITELAESVAKLNQQTKVTECVARTSAIRNAFYHCISRCAQPGQSATCSGSCYSIYDVNDHPYVPEECRPFAPPLQ